MKKLCAIASCFFWMFVFITAANAGNMNKTKEFMNAGMYPQAIAVLEKEIYGDEKTGFKPNPTNAEAQFLLGQCYANLNRFSEADERFASAVKLNADYGYRIAEIYKLIGMAKIGDSERGAEDFLFQAIKYNRQIRIIIANDLTIQGNFFLKQELAEDADRAFSFAIRLENSLEQSICEQLYSTGEKAEDDAAIKLYPEPKIYCSSYNEKAGRRLLEIARKKAKMPNMEQAMAEFKKAAAKFLSEPVVQAELPDYRIYQTGEYAFSLKAGEMTDHWITFKLGEQKYTLGSKDDRFQLLYSDGEIVPAWTPGSFPHKENTRFKILAVTDQPEIRMRVYKP